MVGIRQTAKLLDGALQRAFPGIQFSVQPENEDLKVTWVDGPTQQEVHAIARYFGGADYGEYSRYPVEHYSPQVGSPSELGDPKTPRVWKMRLPHQSLEESSTNLRCCQKSFASKSRTSSVLNPTHCSKYAVPPGRGNSPSEITF